MKIRQIVTTALVGGMAVVISTTPGLAAQASLAPQQPAAEKATAPSDMSAKCRCVTA